MPSYDLYRSPLLSATACLKDGRVRVESHGPLALIPAVRAALEMLDCQPAISADPSSLCLSTWLPPVPGRAFRRQAESRIKALFGVRTPDQVTISVTEECPNRCAHCALPDSGRRLHLEPDRAEDLIRQVLDMGTTHVIFDGGEPALYRELPRLVGSVDDRAISTLFTSGSGFTAGLARRLKDAGLYAVHISLDSPVAEEHDSMRGRQGVFDDAMGAARGALSAGLLVDLYVVLRRENMRHLHGFHDLAGRLGVQEVTFFEVVPTGRWAGRTGVVLTEEDHARLDGFVSQAGPPRIFSVPEAYRRFGCFAASSWMHVTPSGEVYPCACYPQPYGSILREPVRQIWHRMGRFPYKGSKRCPLRN